jgi:hypothetical protein
MSAHSFKSKKKQCTNLISLLVILCCLAVVAVGQQKRGTPRKPAAPVAEPVPTFDSLLADGNYMVYSELRNVGSFVRLQAFNDLLSPLMKLGAPPKEFATALKWVTAHSDALAGSRMFAASMPSRPALPTILIAIEFPTSTEAKKFESELQGFIPNLFSKPDPPPASAAAGQKPSGNLPATDVPPAPPSAPAFQVKQAGTLVFLSDKTLSLRELRPKGSKLLAENPHFALARNRFATESVFIYADFKGMEAEGEKLRERSKKEDEKRREKERAANPSPDSSPGVDPGLISEAMPEGEEEAPPTPDVINSPDDFPEPNGNRPVVGRENVYPTETLNSVIFPVTMVLFGGATKWPEAIAAALAFEEESYVVRALMLNGPDAKPVAVPFLANIATGPLLSPTAPSVMPAEVDLFVSLSLDYPGIYEQMAAASRTPSWVAPASNGVRASPFAALEKKTGFKVKEDLLPLLGNEIAIALPKAAFYVPAEPPAIEGPGPDNEDQQSVRLPEAYPIIAISVRDKEAVRRALPKLIESLSFKGASSMAQTERRDDTEIVSFANVFSYALVGDFLLITPDAKLTRRVVDSYLNQQTLSSDSNFRNFTRWQSRQVHGQVFVSPDLVESYVFAGKQRPQPAGVQTTAVVEPLTYSLSNEGLGPQHELRVPKNVLMSFIAGFSTQVNESPLFTNESIAQSNLRTLSAAQATFHSTTGNGRYGTLDELITADLMAKDLVEKYGYKIELTIMSNKFEAVAVPIEYGKTGRRSFFIDESGVLRGGDHGGGAATLADKPIEH